MSEIPEKAEVIFVVGSAGVGKSSLINYLLGHGFKLNTRGNILDVEDKTKQNSLINANQASYSTFKHFEVFLLNEHTYLCELPDMRETVLLAQCYTLNKWEKKKAELFESITQKKLSVRFLVTIQASVLGEHIPLHFGDEWLNDWMPLLEAYLENIALLINCKRVKDITPSDCMECLKQMIDYCSDRIANIEKQLKDTPKISAHKSSTFFKEPTDSTLSASPDNDDSKDLLLQTIKNVNTKKQLFESLSDEKTYFWRTLDDKDCRESCLSYLTKVFDEDLRPSLI